MLSDHRALSNRRSPPYAGARVAYSLDPPIDRSAPRARYRMRRSESEGPYWSVAAGSVDPRRAPDRARQRIARSSSGHWQRAPRVLASRLGARWHRGSGVAVKSQGRWHRGSGALASRLRGAGVELGELASSLGTWASSLGELASRLAVNEASTPLGDDVAGWSMRPWESVPAGPARARGGLPGSHGPGSRLRVHRLRKG
jgi:hypothetical protein